MDQVGYTNFSEKINLVSEVVVPEEAFLPSTASEISIDPALPANSNVNVDELQPGPSVLNRTDVRSIVQ